ncbi:MAG: hypothetical protein JO115_06040 [Pseudonocardiales bacterium]|nr:hypothetical protein [Pseudonocardiales bacterium]
MAHFLLVYDRSAGKLLHEEQYQSRADALRSRFVAEAEHRQAANNVEVVVLSARSREDLLRTHARYFRSLAELASRTG